MTHAVIWIDHKEARIFHVHPEAADESTLLIVGPASAKLEFFKFVHEHHRPLNQRLLTSRQRIIRPVERSSPVQDAISRRATEWAVHM